MKPRNDVRNLAIIAHVDHGKTTLVDAMLAQSRIFRAQDHDPQRVLAALDRDSEKQISVMTRVTSISYREARINIVDVPGQAGFGGEIDRAFRMVEGVLLLVDAVEGPLPQTRFVMRKALEARLAPIVAITRIDRPHSRPDEVLVEVRELFRDLDAAVQQMEFPVVYCNARDGICRTEPGGADQPMFPLFDEILRTVPPPQHDPAAPVQFLVTALEYDDFLGRLALGRIYAGDLWKGRDVAHCDSDGKTVQSEIGGILGFDGTGRVEVERAGPGDIVSVTGIEAIRVGDTLCDPDSPKAMPPLGGDELTLAVLVEVNDSPTAGIDGTHASREKLRERLWREILTNTAIRIEETDSVDAFLVSGRAELQLVILIEMIRREGYEMLVGRPRVLTREADDRREEPMELLVVDCPDRYTAVVTEKVGARRGSLTKMVNHGTGRVRMEFRIPSRGLIGFRAEFLSDTKGTGIVNHLFDGYDEWAGEIPHRSTGSLVADRPGRATAHALEHLQPRGTLLVAPGDEVYQGMIVGENSRAHDLRVDVTKVRKHVPDETTAPHPVGLIPPRSISLEQALEFVRDDERVEVTPRTLRLRKKELRARG